MNPRLLHFFSNNACTVILQDLLRCISTWIFISFHLFRNFWLWNFWGNERALKYEPLVLKRTWKLSTDHMDWQVFLLHYLYLVSRSTSASVSSYYIITPTGIFIVYNQTFFEMKSGLVQVFPWRESNVSYLKLIL